MVTFKCKALINAEIPSHGDYGLEEDVAIAPDEVVSNLQQNYWWCGAITQQNIEEEPLGCRRIPKQLDRIDAKTY